MPRAGRQRIERLWPRARAGFGAFLELFLETLANFRAGSEMEINAELDQSAVVLASEIDWVDSPMPGVERKMLERRGGEVARATSVVRYAAGSSFSSHVHGGGEEFLVLEGVFADEHGSYPAGTYVRNPPGSRHTPRSPDGCTLFVKLRQMIGVEGPRVVIDTAATTWALDESSGNESLLLFRGRGVEVDLLRLAPGGEMEAGSPSGGLEWFVVDGTVEVGGESYPRWSWMRLPPGAERVVSSASGATLYIKRGHLGNLGGELG